MYESKKRSTIFFYMVFAIIIAFSLIGCSNKSAEDQLSETQLEEAGSGETIAYYQKLTEEDVVSENGVYYAESQLFLTAVESASFSDVEALTKSIGGQIVGYLSETNDYQLKLEVSKPLSELETLCETLAENSMVEEVMPAYLAQLEIGSVDYTKDPWIDADDASDTSGSVWDAEHPDGKNWWAEAIDLPDVWKLELQTTTVKVGIIDSMFDITNEDLDEGLFVQLWNNPTDGEGTCCVTKLYQEAAEELRIAKKNDDVDGIKAAEEKLGNISHGSHVAGIIAAQAENGFGIAGINQNVELYGYARLSDAGLESTEAQWGSVFAWKYAIAQMLNQDVKVINISMGFNEALVGAQDGETKSKQFISGNSTSLEKFLLKYIQVGKEFLIVKSAGNDSQGSAKRYDAQYDILGAIANETVAKRILIVGAAGLENGVYSIASFSNTGERVNVYAPGVDVLSDMPNNVTACMSGTSMATPIVTGLVSLIWSVNPELSSEQVRDILCASTCVSSLRLVKTGVIKNLLYHLPDDATPIVNAYMCVQWASESVGKEVTSESEYSTVMGMIYAISEDKEEFHEISDPTIRIYDMDDVLIAEPTLERLVDGDGGLPSYSCILQPGTYSVEVAAEGYETNRQELVIGVGEVTILDFEMEKEEEVLVVVIDAAEVNADAHEKYAEVLEQYIAAINDADLADMSDTEIEAAYEYVYKVADFLEKNSKIYYAFCDIDGNGVDEMLLKFVGNEAAVQCIFHYDGNMYSGMSGDSVDQSDIYVYTDGTIILFSGGIGFGLLDYYRYNNSGKLEHLARYSYATDTSKTYADEYGQEITEAEFYTLTKGIAKERIFVEWNELDYTIEKKPTQVSEQHTYKLFSDMGITWTEAKEYCEGLGGHLATITSASEQEYINSLLSDSSSNCYWLGGYYENSCWNWVTGEAFSYENWAANEPNDENNSESYIHLFGQEWTGGYGVKNIGEWNDAGNSGAGYAWDFYELENFGFICEWDVTKN